MKRLTQMRWSLPILTGMLLLVYLLSAPAGIMPPHVAEATQASDLWVPFSDCFDPAVVQLTQPFSPLEDGNLSVKARTPE